MIYLLTYDRPHRKTQELLMRYALRGIRPTIVEIPWIDRKVRQPLYDLGVGEALESDGWGELADLIAGGEKISEELPTDGRYVIGGAQLLPDWFVEKYFVLNAHPGWLPEVRGLDSLKWAIYHNQPIGVTVHRIDKKIDLGKWIVRGEVPLSPTDTIHSIARRQHELCLDSLVEVSLRPEIECCDYTTPPLDPTLRMPHRTEVAMMEKLKLRLAGCGV